MWHIDATDEYLEWFREQEPDVQDAVLPKVLLLEAFGPQLGRPHADTLNFKRKLVWQS